LTAARELGLVVPADLSIVSWEDSAAVRRADPPLASVSRDVTGRGARAAQALVALLAGELAGGMLLEPLRLVPTRSIGRPGARFPDR
jgi:DNA-binding LacI/PurR family transcriptional regulator